MIQMGIEETIKELTSNDFSHAGFEMSLKAIAVIDECYDRGFKLKSSIKPEDVIKKIAAAYSIDNPKHPFHKDAKKLEEADKLYDKKHLVHEKPGHGVLDKYIQTLSEAVKSKKPEHIQAAVRKVMSEEFTAEVGQQEAGMNIGKLLREHKPDEWKAFLKSKTGVDVPFGSLNDEAKERIVDAAYRTEGFKDKSKKPEYAKYVKQVIG